MLCPTREFLGYAGLLPFVILTAYIGLYNDSFGVLLFSSYSAVIASFIAGTLWGQALHVSAVNRTALFIFSNLLCIIAWVSLALILFSYSTIGLCILLSVFLCLYFVEKYFLWQVLEFTLLDRLHHYWRLRGRLTFIVITCHILAILFLLMSA